MTFDNTPVPTGVAAASLKVFGETFNFSSTYDVAPPTVAANSVSVNSNTGVITATVNDAITNVAGAQYRLQRPDGTVTGWVDMQAVDGDFFNELSEQVTATVDTSKLAPGTYGIEVRAIDSAGNVNVANNAPFTVAVNTGVDVELVVTEADIAAPVVTMTGAAATYYTVDTATAENPANSFAIEGLTVTDDSTVKNVQYCIQSYNTVTQVYTTVVDWTNATADDGAFNEATETFGFQTGALEPGKSYRIQVRSEDSEGNVSAAVPVTAGPGGKIVTGGANGVTAAATNTFTLPTVANVLPSLAGGGNPDDSVAPTITGAGTAVAPSNSRTIEVTGTADADIAADTGQSIITKVEYAVYLDSDNDGEYDTTVVDFTSTGVTADDGAFDGELETFTINFDVAQDGAYRVAVRTTNAAGNSTIAVDDTVIDATAPTASIAQHATDKEVFIFTFSEEVDNTPNGADSNAISASALDVDNYKVRTANGQIVEASAVSVTQVGTTNVFEVEFANAPQAGYQVTVVGVEDLAGNKVNPEPTSYTVK